MKTRNREKGASVEPEAAKRTSRKRRASTSSEVSQQPEDGISASQASASASQSQSKRRKKTRAGRAESTPAEDAQLDDAPHPQLEAVEEERQLVTIDANQPPHKQVRFDQEEVQDDGEATATNLTPHVRKHTVHRRITLSPADLRNGTKPSLKSRPSLPAAFASPSTGSPAVKSTDIDFVSLKDLVKQRIAERLEEKTTLFQLDGSDDVDVEDDDMMVYHGQENGVAYPALSASRLFSPTSATQATTGDLAVTETRTLLGAKSSARAEVERAAFEDAIKRLTREASDAKAALQILTIELQSLGFGGEETSVETVVTSIRQSFSNIRERLESLLPGQVPSGTSNSELVEFIAHHVTLLSDQVASHEQAISDKDQLQQELIAEIDALVDKLTDSEIRKTKLENANGEFDAQGQEDELYIQNMEKNLREVEKQHAAIQALLSDKLLELKRLDRDNTQLDTTVKKLGKALEDYRLSEQKLQALITRMEHDHSSAVTKLESDLEEETSMRKIAEADADDKQTAITELEVRYEESQSLLDTLKQQLAELQDAEALEREAKEAAEIDRDEKTTFITELEIRVAQSEADLEELNTQLEQLRNLHQSEKRQREAAETDLDDRNIKISDLDAKLHKHGMEANELRQKLFEVQMRETQMIKTMEGAAADREEQFQADMAAEIERREQADQDVLDRDDIISDLKERLRATEQQMLEALAERDEKVSELAAQVDRLQDELDAANNAIDDATANYQELRAASQARIAQLEGTVSALETDLATHATSIVELERQATSTSSTHVTAIEQRDTHIANLNHDLYLGKTRIESLERRVESEAEAMLELQASKDDEIADLQSTVGSKQTAVDDLITKAEDVDRAWNALLRERDSTVEELTEMSNERLVLVTRLRKENADIKEMFRNFYRDATATTGAMRAELEALRSAAAQKDEDLRDEGQRYLEEMEKMDVVGEIVQVQTKSVKKLKKFTKTSKRQYDSGIGVVETEETLLG